MTTTTPTRSDIADPWRGFVGTAWRTRIDVADFIRANVRRYTGESAFLCGPTRRTSHATAGAQNPAVSPRVVADVQRRHSFQSRR